MRFVHLVALVLATTLPSTAEESPGDDLTPRHSRFLEEVELLMDDIELETFQGLRKDYQRDAFVRRFWAERDPWPETARNELRERWQTRAEEARASFGSLSDDRAKMLLLNGPPGITDRVICLSHLHPLEIWRYNGSDVIRGGFNLVFYAPLGGLKGRYKLWYPSQGLQPLLKVGIVGTSASSTLEEQCPDGVESLFGAADWGLIESKGPVIRHPGSEWVLSFAARSTDLPEGAEPLPAELELYYPGKHQSRTVVEAIITVPAEEVREHAFLVDGEVLRQNELFESFRYRFRPSRNELAPKGLPLVLQRHLRPGPYRLILRVQELDSPRVYREERDFEVPRVALLEQPTSPTAASSRLVEAHASLASSEHVIRLIEPPRELLTGKIRIEALAEGPELARVAFWLDDRPIMRKTRPPFSVELALGHAPQLHVVRAAALDRSGKELVSDEIVLNAGPHRFGVRLIEPMPGRSYKDSLRLRAQVEVPEGEAFDRLEIYLGDELVDTLYQRPFDHPVLLPPGDPATFLRATAYLASGTSTEDSVLINIPGHREEIRVQLVELYTTVLDRKGHPVEGLGVSDFTVFEDNEECTIERFDRIEDRPVHAGLLIDTSTSMLEKIDEAEEAAARFLRIVLRPGDRASVMTFNDRPELVVPFTDDIEILAGGLAELTVDGETALWDSLVYAIYYFSGIKGKRVVVLLSDGEDSGSRYGYTEALEFARRTGVAIYTVGLLLPSRAIEAQRHLRQLASETGGRAFFIEKASQLDRVYDAIQDELRSQYLLSYQASSGGDDHDYRRIRVEMKTQGLEAKTISGYYP